jgi:ketosteroid isomerase-like protein
MARENIEHRRKLVTPPSLAGTVQDRLDIADLVHRYAQGIDMRDADAVVSCMADDALLSFNNGELVLNGVEELRRYLANMFSASGPLNPGVAATHLMTNILVTFTNDGAQAETTAVTYRVSDGTLVTRGLRYSDECAQIDGRWVITRRLHRSDWQAEGPGQSLLKS